MRAVPAALLVCAAALALVACAPDDEPDAVAPAPTPAEPDGPEEDVDDEGELDGAVVGRLGGDAQLEGGCVWVETADGTRYEVMWPEGYEDSADPVELRDPDGGVVAREGDEVAVDGTPAQDVATICQIGPVFEATEVRIAGG